MRLYTKLSPKNECTILNGNKTMKVKGLVVHSTGAPNPYLWRYVHDPNGPAGANKYNNHMNIFRPEGRQILVHAWVGLDKNNKVATYQTARWDMPAWHVGGSGNNNYIGVEMCDPYDLNDKKYTREVYQETVELFAYLCKKFNLNPLGKNVIIGHYDAYKLGIGTNHGDPYIWWNKHGLTMDGFRKAVAKEMNKEDKPKVKYVFKPNVGVPKEKWEKFYLYSKPHKNSKVPGTMFTTREFNIVEEIIGGKYLWGKTYDTGHERYLVIAEYDGNGRMVKK